MGRARASFGFVVGGLALGAGVLLRGAGVAGVALPLEQAILPWATLALSVAAVLTAWLARPEHDPILEWGLLPVAGALGVVMPLFALLHGDLAEGYLPAGLEAAGGFALIVSGLRFFRAQGARAIAPTHRLDKRKARLIREGQKKRPEVPAASLEPGDRVEVKAGARIPIDGAVEEGSGFVEESALVGPALPAAKKAGDGVFAGTTSSAPQLVVKALRPVSESLLAQREARLAAIGPDLGRVHRGGRIWAGVAGLLVVLAAAVPFVTRDEVGPWTSWLPGIAGVTLAVVMSAASLAAARARLSAAGWLRGRGVVLSRAKDVDALMRARRWQVDPLLLAAPGKVEVVALADVPADTLLAVADALLSETYGPEHISVRGALDDKKLERLQPAAVSREEGVWRGTVNGRRWYLGPQGALEAEVEAREDLKSPIGFLRDQGHLVLVLGRDDEGVLGALGVSVAAREDAQKAARALGATISPGLPDATRQAVARAAGVDCDGPPLGKHDATLLTAHAELPSAGCRLRVIEPTPMSSLPEAAAPRILRPALTHFGETATALPGVRREAARRIAVVVFLPAVAMAGLGLAGMGSPGVGAILGLMAVAFAGRAYRVGSGAAPAAEDASTE